MTKKYGTPTAFRTALEERLKNLSKKHGIDLHKLRRQVAFDRLLCRLFRSHPGNLFLKGGYSMELRIQKARTTKDIDLVLRAKTLAKRETQDQEIFDLLQAVARKDLNDFFIFFVGNPTLDLEAVPYGGSRFPIEAHLDGRRFLRFSMDVVVSSMVLEPIEEIGSQNWLEFAGIETMPFPAISREQQFAEKFHAYTLPREEFENSRVKDMVDLALLIGTGELQMNILKIAMDKVFEYRATHALPAGLLEPPKSWVNVFTRLSKETRLDVNMDQATADIATHLNLPIFVREGKAVSVPKQMQCYFCGNQSLGWLSNLQSGAINETEETMDFNCQKCHSYRVTGSFMEINNSQSNRNWWSSWADYLQSRSKEEGKSRILISTSISLPKR